MSVDRVRVLIADDHPFFREGLRVVLEATPDMELAGEAEDGDQAVDLARAVQPDVVLMDLKMPGTGGIAATRRILEDSPRIGVLVVTMVEEDDSVFAAMRAGARGYLLKGADREQVVLAIRAVSRGEGVFGPALARRLVHYFSPRSTRQSARSAFPGLTDREREILDLVATGRSNQDIAETLCLSPKTCGTTSPRSSSNCR